MRKALLAVACASVMTGIPLAALAGEAAPALARTWVDDLTKPTDWLTWGADLRLREKYLENHLSLDDSAPGNVWHYERYRTRVWTTVMPADWLDLNFRLTWEGRHWWEPDTNEEFMWFDVPFDNLNARIKLKEQNTTITVGRQDIILGDGWLVLDGTPLDGSRTIYFDAIRGVVELKEMSTTLDMGFIQQWSDPDVWLPPINSQSIPMHEQDERGAFIQAAWKASKDTTITPYFIYKNSDAELANGDTGDIYCPGIRVTHDFSANWKASAEAAYQFGTRENEALFGTGSEDVSAFGGKAQLAYHFNDSWKNQIKVGYEYLSGDDPDSSQIEQFQLLWGRWPQWSELYIYTYAPETRIADVTNLHRAGIGWQANPDSKMTLTANYHALFADQTFGSRLGYDDGSFRGHLVTAQVAYKFSRFVEGHIRGEYFIPGDFYSDERDDDAIFLRAELMFMLK